MDQTGTSLVMANGSSVAVAIAQATHEAFKDVVERSSQSPSWLGLLVRLLSAIIRLLPSIIFWLITFVSITLPTWLFTLFSTSLTFTMNMTTL